MISLSRDITTGGSKKLALLRVKDLLDGHYDNVIGRDRVKIIRTSSQKEERRSVRVTFAKAPEIPPPTTLPSIVKAVTSNQTSPQPACSGQSITAVFKNSIEQKKHRTLFDIGKLRELKPTCESNEYPNAFLVKEMAAEVDLPALKAEEEPKEFYVHHVSEDDLQDSSCEAQCGEREHKSILSDGNNLVDIITTPQEENEQQYEYSQRNGIKRKANLLENSSHELDDMRKKAKQHPTQECYPYCQCCNSVATNSTMSSITAGCSSDGSVNCMLQKNELLCSATNTYQVLGVAGQGAFGKVVICWVEGTRKLVALKMSKKSLTDHKTQREAQILQKLSEENVDEFHVVRLYESFTHKNHLCLVFECLEQSLQRFIRKMNFCAIPMSGMRIILKQLLTTLVKLKYNFVRLMDVFSHKGSRCMVFEILERSLCSYLKGNYFYALPTTCIRTIVRQLLISLAKLQELRLIHADIKPQNIMLVNSEKYPWRVKLIDFGCSMIINNAHVTQYVQTRYYRAPEIMEFPFSESIDMWALGCVMAELFTGRPLYPGSSEYDQIRFICNAQGPLPECLLQSGSRTYKFFNRELDRGTFSWKLKTPEEYEIRNGRNSIETKHFFIESLDELIEVVLCWMEGTSSLVALKILKRRHSRELREVSILKQLCEENVDEFNVVRLHENCLHKNMPCLVFEALEQNLDFLKKRNFRPVPLIGIRSVLKQLIVTLRKLKEMRLTHLDMKPANIMLVNTKEEPYLVEVIDFGCAINTSSARFPTYVQTRNYRCPEIILGLPFCEAADMWSLGCIAAQLLLFRPFYPGRSEYDQVQVPKGLSKEDLAAEMEGRNEFVHLLKKMLAFDQKERISPEDALKHTFLTEKDTVQHAHKKSHPSNHRQSSNSMHVSESFSSSFPRPR